MEQVNVILPTRSKTNLTGKEWKLLKKEQFRELVFQAYYYPDTTLTIGKVVVAKRDVTETICGKARSINKIRFENVVDCLWNRLHHPANNIMRFKSALEDIEYVIDKLKTE